jgi:hypothetical protein
MSAAPLLLAVEVAPGMQAHVAVSTSQVGPMKPSPFRLPSKDGLRDMTT